MHLHGAGNRVPPDATAYGQRNVSFVLNIAAQWVDRDDSQRHMEWARAFWEDLHPYAVGTYGNFLNPDDGEDRVRKSFGGNYERLSELKAKYDPENVFRFNVNVQPQAAGAVRCGP
jgi:FAD/FMN-containing dehydrogenase